MIKFRNLKENEIEVRRGRKIGETGKVELLIYKNSRVDMAILDETVGCENWVVQYKREGDTLLCGIGIFSEKHKAFIYKWAAGAEQQFEKTKSEQSDALKRAGFVWNIGRNLYTAPRIVVTPKNDWEQYYVDEIGYDSNDRINNLEIVNGDGDVVYRMRDGKKVPVAQPSEVSREETLRIYCGEQKKVEGVDKNQLLKFYEYYKTRVQNFDNFSAGVCSKLWSKWCSH